MKVMAMIEALMRRDAVKVDDRRAIIVLDVGTEVAARFMVLGDDARVTEPLTLGEVVSMTADLDAITMDEAFLIDALRQSEADASSTYLSRVLDRINATA